MYSAAAAARRRPQDDRARATFAAVSPHFEAGASSAHNDPLLHTYYVEGLRHTTNPAAVSGGPEAAGVDPARLPFVLLDNPAYRAYYAGRMHFCAVHLSVDELASGLRRMFGREHPAGKGTNAQVQTGARGQRRAIFFPLTATYFDFTAL